MNRALILPILYIQGSCIFLLGSALQFPENLCIQHLILTMSYLDESDLFPHFTDANDQAGKC